MTDQDKNEIMAGSIVAAVKNHKVCNMTQLAVKMGLLKKGQSVSGSFGKKVKSLVPDIADLFKANGETGKGKEPINPATPIKPIKPVKPIKVVVEPKKAPAKSPQKPAKTPKPGTPSLYPRHEKNPFRMNSSYGKVFDCFASFKNGVRRDELLTKVAEAVGKDLKHAAYDLAVILSAKDSNTGPRHRSCAEGFWVRRENDHLTLVID
jgi:hypothetical protein